MDTLSFLLGSFPGLEFLVRRVTLCLPFEKCQTVFQSGCSGTVLRSDQQCVGVLISPRSRRYVLICLILAIFVPVKHLLFVFVFPYGLVNGVGHFKNVFIGCLHIFFAEMSIQIPCLFLNWFIYLFIVEL